MLCRRRCFSVSSVCGVGFIVMVWLHVATREHPPFARTPVEPHCDRGQNLTKVTALLTPYQRELGRLREKYIATHRNRSGITLAKHPRLISAKRRDYFDQTRLLPNVDTLFLNLSRPAVQQYMARGFYHQVTTNCGAVQGKLTYDNTTYYECRENISAAVQPLVDAVLGVGLPPGFIERPGQGSGQGDEATWTYIQVIRNAVVTGDGDVLSRDFRLVSLRCENKKARKENWINRLQKLPFHREMFTITQYWGSGFYHGTLENLPRIAPYVEFLNSHSEIVIHVASRHPFLDLLGIHDLQRRLVIGDVTAGVVYNPAGGHCGHSPVFTSQLLSLVLSHGVANRKCPQARDVIILIQRTSKRRNRYFRYHAAILKMLKRHAEPRGLRVAVYGDKPVPGVGDTAELFGRALIVVAPHGAGESNLIFSRPGTVLIERLCEGPDQQINLCYKWMCDGLGMRYHGIRNKKPCTETSPEDIERPVRTYLELYDQGLLTDA